MSVYCSSMLYLLIWDLISLKERNHSMRIAGSSPKLSLIMMKIRYAGSSYVRQKNGMILNLYKTL